MSRLGRAVVGVSCNCLSCLFVISCFITSSACDRSSGEDNTPLRGSIAQSSKATAMSVAAGSVGCFGEESRSCDDLRAISRHPRTFFPGQSFLSVL